MSSFNGDEENNCTKRDLWKHHEVMCFLAIMKDLQVVRLMDGKKHRTAVLFNNVRSRLIDVGFTRSIPQLKSKWKRLKADYDGTMAYLRKSGHGAMKKSTLDNRDAGLSEAVLCPFFEELNDILGCRPVNKVTGIDSSPANLQVMNINSSNDTPLRDGSNRENTRKQLGTHPKSASCTIEGSNFLGSSSTSLPLTKKLCTRKSPSEKKASLTSRIQSIADQMMEGCNKKIQELTKQDQEFNEQLMTKFDSIIEKSTKDLLTGLQELRRSNNE